MRRRTGLCSICRTPVSIPLREDRERYVCCACLDITQREYADEVCHASRESLGSGFRHGVGYTAPQIADLGPLGDA